MRIGKKIRIVLATAFAVVIFMGASTIMIELSVPAPKETPLQEQWQNQKIQEESREESGVQEPLPNQGYQPEEKSTTAAPMTDEERIEYINQKAESNPAVARILREGDAKSILIANIENIEGLSTLPQEQIERSLLYIGYFLTEKGYDPETVKIYIFDRMDTWGINRDYRIFYFQVVGEETYYRAFVSDREVRESVSVGELTEHVRGVNDDLY
jgi:hypothetical protein